MIGVRRRPERAEHIALKGEVSPHLPIARGDERKLTQVLLNLVGNAIKFTDRGEVPIKKSAADGSFKIAVRDTGRHRRSRASKKNL
jgi:signal transduction histidine kinase